MKLPVLPNDDIRNKTTDELQKFLLERVCKMAKLNKEMKQSAAVQRAENALIEAKAPYRKVKMKWGSEIEAVELELKTRNIKYTIKWDDIHEEEEE